MHPVIGISIPLIILLALIPVATQSAEPPGEGIVTVTVEDLVKNPEKFSKKKVRVRGWLVRGGGGNGYLIEKGVPDIRKVIARGHFMVLQGLPFVIPPRLDGAGGTTTLDVQVTGEVSGGGAASIEPFEIRVFVHGDVAIDPD